MYQLAALVDTCREAALQHITVDNSLHTLATFHKFALVDGEDEQKEERGQGEGDQGLGDLRLHLPQHDGGTAAVADYTVAAGLQLAVQDLDTWSPN